MVGAPKPLPQCPCGNIGWLLVRRRENKALLRCANCGREFWSYSMAAFGCPPAPDAAPEKPRQARRLR
jgi:hypothetical protein